MIPRPFLFPESITIPPTIPRELEEYRRLMELICAFEKSRADEEAEKKAEAFKVTKGLHDSIHELGKGGMADPYDLGDLMGSLKRMSLLSFVHASV